ncbi:MAG: hypothetical protein AT713_03765 [Caldivirga sp. JCHS_4]|jgi:hypothetical protein|nr:MAG: hypothetical protein AT713_03765 [Caldivirga sp. JCHS_4]
MTTPLIITAAVVAILMLHPIAVLIYDVHNYVTYRKRGIRNIKPSECINGGTLSVIIPTWHEQLSTVVNAVKRALGFNWPGPIEVVVGIL